MGRGYPTIPIWYTSLGTKPISRIGVPLPPVLVHATGAANREVGVHAQLSPFTLMECQVQLKALTRLYL